MASSSSARLRVLRHLVAAFAAAVLLVPSVAASVPSAASPLAAMMRSGCTIASSLTGGNMGFAADFGQSFQATCNGTLQTIGVRAGSPQAGLTITVYAGEGMGGSVLGSVSGVSLNGNGSVERVDLSSANITLTAGSTYTFEITGGNGDFYYDSGHVTGYIYLGQSATTSHDMHFEVVILGSNNAPTDVALSNASVGHSGGTNAVVGTLTTTDADGGDVHSYSLVTGTGSTHNGLFNISGSQLRAANAAAMSPGAYSVRVQTSDGNGGTHAEAFSITVTDDRAPLFANGTPSVYGITKTGATLTVRLDEPGAAYYVLVSDGSPVPSIAEVRAGQSSGGGIPVASGSLSVAATGTDYTAALGSLSAGTAYDLYAVGQDDEATPNVQSAVTQVGFTTVPLSSNADLSSLALSSGTLTPAFGAATTSYTASVSNAVTSVDVTPTVADANATVEVEGTHVASGNPHPVALVVGANTITTVVTAESGATKTYTVTVTRAASSNADLSNLTLSTGVLSPVFDAATTTYTAAVPGAVTSVDVTPTVADANATVEVEGTHVASGNPHPVALVVGANTITTVVTAQDGSTTKTYTLTVTREVDGDGALVAAAGVAEPVGLGTTADTDGEAVDVLDFTLADGGTADGLAMTVSQIVVRAAGTTTDAERAQLTLRLNGPDAANVPAAYDPGADAYTFAGLAISVADAGSETYTLNAYWNNSTGLAEGHTLILSVDGDADVTTGAGGTSMGAGQAAVTSGAGSTVDVAATRLAFTAQPGGSVSGSTLTAQPVVTAQDVFGNTDVDFAETITLTEASAGTLANAAVAATHGVATFTNLAYTATADQETFTLTANDQDGAGSDLPTADANAVTSDVVATRLVFAAQPAPTSVDNGVPTNFTTLPVVQAVDAAGTVDTGYGTAIALAEVNGAGSATLWGTGDVDGSAATVTLTPVAGTAAFSDLHITYHAAGDVDEPFNLQASSGGLTTADSAPLTGVVNRAPTFDAGASAALPLVEDGAAAALGALLAATDGDDDQTLTWTVTSGPSQGTLAGFPATAAATGASVQPAGLTYTPDADANGADAFTVQVSDGTATHSVTVSVAITAVNDAPAFAAGGDVTVAEDAGAQTVAWASGVSVGPANEAAQTPTFDVQAGNAALFAVPPALAADGTLTFTPAADAFGTATVTVTLTDDGGTANGGVDASAPATFTLTVTAVNDAPVVAVNAGLAVDEAGAAPLADAALDAADVDDAAAALAYTVTAAPAHGRLELASAPGAAITAFTEAERAAGAVRYVHDGSNTTADAFSFSLADAAGAGPAGQVVAVTVGAVNDAPTITALGSVTLRENEPSAPAAFTVADEETAAGALVVTAATSDPHVVPLSGVVFGGAHGARTVAVTPAPGVSGTATITVTVSDGALTVATSFTVTVAGVNDAPSFTAGGDVTVAEDAGAQSVVWASDVTAGPADEAGQGLVFDVQAGNAALFAVPPALAADGTLTFTPAADAFGTATVTVMLADDGGTANGGVDASAPATFTLTVAAVNDAPTLAVPGAQAVDAGQALVLGSPNAITVDDVDAERIVVVIRGAGRFALGSTSGGVYTEGTPAEGHLRVVGPPAAVRAALDGLAFTPAAEGAAPLTVEVTDGVLAAAATIPVTVRRAAPTPPSIASVGTVTLDEDASATITVTLVDADTAPEALVLAAVPGNAALLPAEGLVLAGTGAARTLTLTPAPDAHGATTVTLTVTDGVHTARATFRVVVTPVNDAPRFPVAVTPAPDPSATDGEATTTIVMTGVAPSTPIRFTWAAADDADADAANRAGAVAGKGGAEASAEAAAEAAVLTYVWELAVDTSFAAPLLRVETGTATYYETTYGALAALVDGLADGPDGGGEVHLVHRVRVTDGQAAAYSAPAPLVLVQGSTVGTEAGLPSEVPAEATLAGNYPNPFNPSTRIRYAVPSAGDVRLEVFDALGRRVRTLVDARQAAGWHEVTFEASGLPSGTYVYRLVAGGAVRAGTLVLAK